MNKHIQQNWIRQITSGPDLHPYDFLVELYLKTHNRVYPKHGYVDLFKWAGIQDNDNYWNLHRTWTLHQSTRDSTIRIIISL